MFRQIWLHPDDQNLLKIVWRDSNSDPIREYQLTTVTYGTKAAPFLAMMTLKQLASDERNNYLHSSAIEVLENSFYMDDVIHGCHSIEEAKRLQSNLIKLLQSSGFNLRKWKSNTTELSQNIKESNNNSSDFNFKQSETTKTLGLGWNPEEDIFTFHSQLEPLKSSKITKRMLLSDISKLFDPIGWLSPLSTKLKIIFQQVWAAHIEWDDQIPEEIYKEWIKVRNDISMIKDIKLPRWIHTRNCDSIELHGFCDSSMKAYACVIYCRVNKGEDSHNITLLVGKTRLVPTSKVVTLPRLELSGALLLSKLMNKVKECLKCNDIKMYGWADSTVVLGWLQGNAARWKTFVANRVQQITKVMPPDCWRYVKSEENPADCASRGLSASQLKDHSLWWQGPKWLSTFSDKTKKVTYSTDQELKVSKQVTATVTNHQNNSIIIDILSKHSTFRKAVRIVAWMCRFTNNKKKYQSYLSVEELKHATLLIIRNIQQLSFEKEISDLRSGNNIHKKSKLCELNPYIDQQQIIRVGGRLRHAYLDPDMKNPIIIPNNSRLSELLINEAHQSTYHGGARLTSSYLRQKYWIMGGYRAVKKIVRQCIKCRRHNPSKHHQIMGDLPAARVNPSRPFYNVGVDYTGHVFIKSNAGRGIKTTKGYIAVFTCMATKAVHLELVSDLSSASFISALRRMSARRGKPGHIYSDNGTNFIGANKILQQEYDEILKIFNTQFQSEVADMGITWHFNAPSWPSASGLSEAAV
ncbi:uncharacterized protein LOC123702247 [Colias croceus]|uniref:uncharacterized protein LOC123702247 n=1 Tax=Colias crocea TaxID=72248 RepID=UPI001E281601|nr:uncharacterized protein LOC123702247 [Colias croceus]